MADEAVHISLTEEEKRRFRMEAGRQDLSMSEFGRQVLTEWIDENVAES